MKNYIFKKWVVPKVRPLWSTIVSADKEFVDAVASAPKKIRKTFVFFIYLGFGPLLWTEYQIRRNHLILGIEDEVTVNDIFGF